MASSVGSFGLGTVCLLACVCSTGATPPSMLAYTARAPVDDVVARQMVALSTAWSRIRTPWKDHLDLHAMRGVVGDGRPKVLFGRLVLAVGEYEPEVGRFRVVADSEEALAVYAEARWALLQLEHWARLYGINWDVQFGGTRGRVTASGLDAGASRILAMLCARAGEPADGRVEVLRAALNRKYGDRP
jgi:hypothetical protein